MYLRFVQIHTISICNYYYHFIISAAIITD